MFAQCVLGIDKERRAVLASEHFDTNAFAIKLVPDITKVMHPESLKSEFGSLKFFRNQRGPSKRSGRGVCTAPTPWRLAARLTTAQLKSWLAPDDIAPV